MRARTTLTLPLLFLAMSGVACSTDQDPTEKTQPDAVAQQTVTATPPPAESVIVRVPVGDDGQEVAANAEMRLSESVAADQGFDALVTAFDAGRAPEDQALGLQDYSYGGSSYGGAGWNNHRGWGGGYDNYQPQYGYNNNRWTYNYDYSYSSPWSRNPYGYNRRPCHSGRYNYYYYQPQPGYGYPGGGWRH